MRRDRRNMNMEGMNGNNKMNNKKNQNGNTMNNQNGNTMNNNMNENNQNPNNRNQNPQISRQNSRAGFNSTSQAIRSVVERISKLEKPRDLVKPFKVLGFLEKTFVFVLLEQAEYLCSASGVDAHSWRHRGTAGIIGSILSAIV